MELDPRLATVVPKATGISWPLVKYIPSWQGLVRSFNRSFPLTFTVLDKAGGGEVATFDSVPALGVGDPRGL